MNRFLISCLIGLFISLSAFAAAQTVEITILAPDFVNKEVRVQGIQDYLSDLETTITAATVREDSSCTVRFEIEETQKIILRSENSFGYMYVEPGGNYKVYFPSVNPGNPKSASSNLVELAFIDLSKHDVNYKILSFQRWQDEYVSRYYYLRGKDPKLFAEKLDTFKIYVEKAYANDSSVFFLNYVKFSMAQLDDIQFAASRNRYEKYDFYLKKSPVFYHNDLYMQYVESFYKNLVPRMSVQTNNAVYLAVLKSSPTAVMKAYGTEYTTQNLQLRELVMIQNLCEEFYRDDFPQTNILTILDSLSERALFKEHRIIAKNMRFRLLQLLPGSKVNPFFLSDSSGIVATSSDFYGKYLYLHFFDGSAVECLRELDLLEKLHEEYKEHVNIVSVDLNASKSQPYRLPWKIYPISENQHLRTYFEVKSVPHYVLIDAQGYLVSSPALRPTPNRQYETIDKTFFYIRKNREAGEPR